MSASERFVNWKYNCLNPIAEVGLKNLPDNYARTEDFASADAVFVRSAKMDELTPGANLLAVARAGAGVNNIPHAEYAKKGIVVFNTPGANANGVKELVIAAMLLASRDIVGGIEWVKANAADAAMKEIHGLVHERFEAMVGAMSASGRDVRMVFDNYSEIYAEALGAIRDAVDGIPGCNNATIRVDGPARVAEIGFRCQTDMDTFRKLMEGAMKEAVPSVAMRPDTVTCDANTWRLAW